MKNLNLLILAALFHVSLLVFSSGESFRPESNTKDSRTTPFYHLGPVMSNQINLYIIWYGAKWKIEHKQIILDFINSLSAPPSSVRGRPQVSEWWGTMTKYTDQTNSGITRTIKLAGEFNDTSYYQSISLKRLSMQYIVKYAVHARGPGRLPSDPTGLYLILTSQEVHVQDFCRAACGFHYFTFPSVFGVVAPYAWVGYSGIQCPEYCGYPFVTPKYGPKLPKMLPPNGDVGVDAMINVIGHELAETSSNPLVNSWYAGDQLAPLEIADACTSIFGKNAGGGYPGVLVNDSRGRVYNLNGVKGRKFLVQWVWSIEKEMCYGPNQ